MKKIKLSKGYETTVDDDDFIRLNKISWHYHQKGYARGCLYLGREGGKQLQKNILMHRLIMGEPKGMMIDHINGDKLDNRKENLRICTNSENMMNQKTYRRNVTSKYKGVHWCKKDKKWKAQIEKNGKGLYLGSFENEINAAKVYNEKAKDLHGEYACLNIIPNGLIIKDNENG